LIAYSKDEVKQNLKNVRVLGNGENKEQNQSDTIAVTLKEEAACYGKMSEQAPATKT
jgi:hypothetical protein